MRIGVIQASTRVEINELFYQSVIKAVDGHHAVFNLGVFPNEVEHYSYVEVALMISLLIESGSLDFVVTGCSSGQGMMMACNSLPGLHCGYVQTPQDAYLFGRINNGNVVSLPLGFYGGWSGELNLQYTLDKLFDGEFNVGYPVQDAERKCQEASQILSLAALTKRPFQDIVDGIEDDVLVKILSREVFCQFLFEHATNLQLVERLKSFIH